MLIITKRKSKTRRGVQANKFVGPYGSGTRRQYEGVSKENKETFRREKTVQTLARQGFNEAAISGMMGINEKPVRKMMKRTGENIVLDGKY